MQTKLIKILIYRPYALHPYSNIYEVKFPFYVKELGSDSSSGTKYEMLSLIKKYGKGTEVVVY